MDERYLKGLEHFNNEEFFEAHELLESLWGDAANPLKKFYQGIIQSAVALHHLRNGNLKGARNEYRLSMRKLCRYLPFYEGMDVETFVKEMDALFAPLFSVEGRKVPQDYLQNVTYPKILLKNFC